MNKSNCLSDLNRIAAKLRQLSASTAATNKAKTEIRSTLVEVGVELEQLLKNEETNATKSVAFLLTHLRSMKEMIDDLCKIEEKSDAKIESASAAKNESHNEKSKDNQLDKFSEDREAAIDSTIVGDGGLTFKEVAGLRVAKQALTEAVVDPIKYPHWFEGGRRPWRCILLYGPPGTGKSRLAQALAGELSSAIVYRVSSADLVSTWVGQSEKLIRDLFTHALNQQPKPALIFIDEIDSLCRQRSSREEEGTRRVKTELLLQMQRIHESNSSNVFLLCATNCPWEIDPAFLRRFQKRIFVGLPEKEGRVELLKKLLNINLSDVQWSEIGDKTKGTSGNDLSVLAQEILYIPLRELRRTRYWIRSGAANGIKYTPYSTSSFADKDRLPRNVVEANLEKLPRNTVCPRPLQFSDILDALASDRHRTITDAQLKRFDEFTKFFGIAG